MYTCETCGAKFKSHNSNPRYCSRNCRGKAERADIDFDLAVRRYESGMTQMEVARTFGVTQKAIKNLFERNGYQSRIAAKRDQRGVKNHTWKGALASYTACHNRVYRTRRKPRKCEVCNTDDPGKKYEWANLTGKYHDPHDYKRMCGSCHKKHDGHILNIHHMREKLNGTDLR